MANIEGAIDLMQRAYDSTPYQELEDRAWLLTQIAHLQLAAGRLPEAEKFAAGAWACFPDYHYALGDAGPDPRGAEALRRSRGAVRDSATQPRRTRRTCSRWRKPWSMAGRHEEAAQRFAEFERQALKESALADNANHELAAYYTDYAQQPEKALHIAEAETARRHDAYTLDAYAWALAATGDYPRANAEVQKALAFGLKDAKVLAHASSIADHCGEQCKAAPAPKSPAD